MALRDTRSGQFDRLVDLYITNGLSLEKYTKRETELKQACASLDKQLEHLNARLIKRELNDELGSLNHFANALRARSTTLDYDGKRRILELLNVRAIMAVEDEERVVYVTTALQNTVAPLRLVIDPRSIYNW